MDDRLTVGSLFSGIGGFDLGFERAGMRTLWFCEQDAYCQRVLAKNFPGVPCYPDVRALVADADETGLRGVAEHDGGQTNGRPIRGGPHVDGRDHSERRPPDAREGQVAGEGLGLPVPVPYVDVLAGGFPCQDISLAGRGGGIRGGSRSGLWREFARLIGELRPRYVVVENVPAITSRGLDIVLADLAACGFDAEWDHLPASAFGAPHRRDRFWLVAYPEGSEGRRGAIRGSRRNGRSCLHGAEGLVADASRNAAAGSGAQTGAERERARQGGQRSGAATVADSEGIRQPTRSGQSGSRGAGEQPTVEPKGRPALQAAGGAGAGHWKLEPDVGRVANGIPQRVDRLRALGNALVPQIAEWIGRRILTFEARGYRKGAAMSDLDAKVCSCEHTAHWHGAGERERPAETMGEGPCDMCDCARFKEDHTDTVASLRARIRELEAGR